MKSNTGVVMQIDKKHAFIMTSSGEFLKVKVGKAIPAIGEIYTGEAAKETPVFRYAATAASLAFVLLFGGVAKAYYTPVSTVEVNINPSVQLQLNRWDRIIKSTPLNSDGEKVLQGLNIKNKPLNDGLDLIVEEAKKDDFINQQYIDSGKTINVSISSTKSDKDFNLSQFEDYTKKNNLNVKINVPSETSDSKNNKTKNKTDVNNLKPDTDNSNDNKSNKTEKGNGKDKANPKAPETKENNGNGNSNKNNDKKNQSSNSENQTIYNSYGSDSQKKSDDTKGQNGSEHKASEGKGKEKNKK